MSIYFAELLLHVDYFLQQVIGIWVNLTAASFQIFVEILYAQ